MRAATRSPGTMMLTLLLAIAALPAALDAQAGTRSAAILIIRGNDTLVVERVQRGDSTSWATVPSS